MEKLKPCPFCGGEAEVIDGTGWVGQAVHCTECPANVYGFEEEDQSVAAWNRRPE
jgi:Lar family restriction alleviation protein